MRTRADTCTRVHTRAHTPLVLPDGRLGPAVCRWVGRHRGPRRPVRATAPRHTPGWAWGDVASESQGGTASDRPFGVTQPPDDAVTSF